jgi:16S rRNA U516 pseudouridylate synthase RsuA-like enzyme
LKLFKYLQLTGYFSRRSSIKLIKLGLIKVNGKIVKEPNYKLNKNDLISFKGFIIERAKKYDYYIYYKPINSLYIPNPLKRFLPLDFLYKNDEGLMVMTNEPDIHRGFRTKFIKKRYIAKLSSYMKEIQKSKIYKISTIANNKVLITTILRASQIHRLFPNIESLKCIEIEPLTFSGLNPGKFRKLNEDEIIALRSSLL